MSAVSTDDAADVVAPGSREQHTFRGNLKSTRHGWLRLTPAYSVRLVARLLEASPSGPVLDPFCGTGTTLLSCAEHGIEGDSVDINPFLVWLARVKVGSYSEAQLVEARRGLGRMRRAARASPARDGWVPPLHQIERWWSPATLAALSRSHRALERFAEGASRAAGDLLRVAFCQVLIARSRAHFGHQSMSFQPDAQPSLEPGAASAEREAVERGLEESFTRVAQAAAIDLPRTRRRVVRADARRLHEVLEAGGYARVITSPPYANRMSYIRELRPYMYWLRYLEEKRAAGVLDWKAIGGTWGSATSNLATWQPEPAVPLPAALGPLITAIAETSPLLSAYVHKYIHDMALHVASLAPVVRRGGSAHYVVGNSKFYDVVVPVELLLAELFEANGFRRVSVETLRKRSSKKELFEYLINADRV